MRGRETSSGNRCCRRCPCPIIIRWLKTYQIPRPPDTSRTGRHRSISISTLPSAARPKDACKARTRRLAVCQDASIWAYTSIPLLLRSSSRSTTAASCRRQSLSSAAAQSPSSMRSSWTSQAAEPSAVSSTAPKVRRAFLTTSSSV